MRSTLFALPLLAALAASAQTSPSPIAPRPLQTPAPIVLHMVPEGNCPVGLFAQRRGEGQTVWAVSLEDSVNLKSEAAARAANTGVHVRLSTGIKSPIRQVEIAVSFLAPGTYVLPVSDTKPTIYRKKTFHLSAPEGGSLKLAVDLLVGPSAGIKQVHILSIDYADGATWTAPNDNACSVEPDGFMLVGAR